MAVNGGVQLPRIPTWKLKHSKDDLAKEMLDESKWNRGFRMSATLPGQRRFPSFSKCWSNGVLLADLQRRRLPAYIGVDLASEHRPGNAIVVVGLEPGTLRRVLLQVRYGAWTSPETAEVLADVCTGHNVQWIQVENNAYQQSLIDWVKRSKVDFPYWMKIEAFTTGKNKADPNYGLGVLEVEFKNDAWIFPSSEWEGHDPTCRCDWCRIRHELRDYPNAGHADGVMATWFARDALNKWAPTQNSGAKKIGSFTKR